MQKTTNIIFERKVSELHILFYFSKKKSIKYGVNFSIFKSMRMYGKNMEKQEEFTVFN